LSVIVAPGPTVSCSRAPTGAEAFVATGVFAAGAPVLDELSPAPLEPDESEEPDPEEPELEPYP
jgi:hypothetical protein